MNSVPMRLHVLLSSTASILTIVMTGGAAFAAPITTFSPGDLVISYVACSVGAAACNSSTGGLDTASVLTLQELQLGVGAGSVTSVGTLALPQTTVGNQSAISGEYGSASEGILQQSANGQYLTIMGYGVNAAVFNSAPSTAYGNAALGQTTSLTQANQTGTPVTTVARVVALVGANGSVDTSTALTGVFNQNNPRSAATVDGSAIYVSGQGITGDGTGGVFYATRGATTATPINNGTSAPSGTPNGTASATFGTETRVVEIANNGNGNQLFVSRDVKAGGTPNDATDIRSFTNASGGLPTSASGLAGTRLINPTLSGLGSSLGGNDASINLTAALANGVNNSRVGKFVYLSPEEFFFANPTTMYVADSGAPKNGSAEAAALGEGGLQKWSLINGVWTLDYDLVKGLNLVDNGTANSSTPSAAGVTGLFGLTGQVVGNQVELFATSYGLNELSPSYLYEITDTLANTTISQAGSETFNTLLAAPTGESIRGVSFAPVPEPASMTLFTLGMFGLGLVHRRTHRSPR